MELENLSQKSQQIVNQVTDTVEEKSKQVMDKIGNITEKKASEVTEEAIIAAVEQGINVLQIASQQVREREIPTEKVDLEVSVSIMNIVELKIKTDVPKSEAENEMDIEVTEKPEE